MKPNSKEIVATPKIPGNEIQDEISELTEWLLQRLKIMYSGKIYEGDNQQEASMIRELWRNLVENLGKNLVMKTVEYFLSGDAVIPDFSPSPVIFSKIARNHVAPNLKIIKYFSANNLKVETCNPETKQKFIAEIRSKLCQVN